MRPYASQQEQHFEVMNEIAIWMTLIFLLLFAEHFIGDGLIGQNISIGLVSITGINILINMIPVVRSFK